MRKRTTSYILAGIMIATWTTGVRATTVDELYSYCTSRIAADRLRCVAWMDGFLDGVKAQIAMTKTKGFICGDSQVSVHQITEMFVNAAREFPHWGNRPANLVLAVTLQNAWPCNGPGGARGRS
jgi:hypothetical protein